MSTSTKSALPVSPTNAALVAVFLLGAVVTAVAGSWFDAALLAAVGLAGLGSALYARRPGSRDVTRVNALEYRDERDRAIAQTGFSAVGIAALVVSAIEFVAVAALAEARDWPPAVELAPAAQLVLLCIVWGVANTVAAKRR